MTRDRYAGKCVTCNIDRIRLQAAGRVYLRLPLKFSTGPMEYAKAMCVSRDCADDKRHRHTTKISACAVERKSDG